MISIAAFNPKKHPLSDGVIKNLARLSRAVAQLERGYGKELTVTSGYRTEEEQTEVDPAHPHSAHCEGLAVDCLDNDGAFWAYLIEELEYVIELGLYLEEKLYTQHHVHMQLKKPKSGNRIFIP